MEPYNNQPQQDQQREPISVAPPQPSGSGYSWQQPGAPEVQPSQAHSPQQPHWSAPTPAGITPHQGPISRAAKSLHLSKGEYVINDVRRHPIGVLQIYFVASVVLLALTFGSGALVRYLQTTPQEGIVGGSAFPFPIELLTGLAFALGLMTVVIAAIAVHVYRGNRLFVTNESVIQHVQTSLFSTKEQTISLGNIEDVSYEQSGIMPHIFHYGTVRLSTEGEETTYYFRYASHPKEQVTRIIEAQESFNNVHPDNHR